MSRSSDFNVGGRSRVGSRVSAMQNTAIAQVEVTDIYKISQSELTNLFNEDSFAIRSALLTKHGEATGLLQKVQSEANTGIMGDERDLYRRQTFYGINEKPAPQMPNIFDSIKEALNEKLYAVIAIFAVLSIITGVIYTPSTGWIEGTSIILALFLLVVISSINDYFKDKTFVNLQGMARDEDVSAVRGKIGSISAIVNWDLVVGDVIYLSAGDKVPADCVIIHSNNLTADQCANENLEAEFRADVPKGSQEHEDPFLYVDSYIQVGSCKAMVAAVGTQSSRGVKDKKYDTETKSPLQMKLTNLSKTFTFIGIIAALVILATQLIMLALGTGFSDSDSKGAMFVKKLVESMTLALIVIIVSIPEGLPMAVSIGLSKSVLVMYEEDKILVRDLAAPEKMGEITEILAGKTGTMTTEEMQVTAVYAQDFMCPMHKPDTFINCNFNDTTRANLIENILYNTEAHIEINENAFYIPVGNGTECSMIRWLQGNEIPVQKEMLKREGNIKAWIPFDTNLKRSIIAIKHPDMVDTVRVYVKGAPEIVIENCIRYNDGNNNALPIDQQHRDYVINQMMRDQMTTKGFRTLAFSFKDYSEEEFSGLSNFNSDDTIKELENGQTFCGIVGMKDPLRARIQQTVQYAQKGGITVRMISGDNIDTAKAMAVDAGILTPAEFNSEASIDDQRKYFMDAKDFRQEVGDLQKQENEDKTITYTLQNQQAFNQIIGTLKVLGRSSPQDKLLITVGLQGMDKKVVVVGDGLNDLDAIERADVSFAMGSGKSISRNAASMVLLNNDLDKVLKAVMWGRNIYTNIMKFLQFQITCNIAALLTIFIGTIFLTESPLSPTQLIWINLIMDILGALALATAKPLASVIHQAAITKDTHILSPKIWRQIYGVAVWMVAIMFIVIWFGRTIFHLDYEKDTQTTDKCSNGEDTCEALTEAQNKKTHMTIIFNTFVFLQFFNQINCRVIGADEYNIFKKPFNSLWFLLVLSIIFFVQWSATTWLLFIFETSILTGEQFFTGVIYGMTVWIAALALKLTPAHWVEKIPIHVNENEVMGADNPLMQGYSAHAKGPVPTFGQGINEDDQLIENENDDEYKQV